MGKLDENDLFEMYGGVEGIKKDPKILKGEMYNAKSL